MTGQNILSQQIDVYKNAQGSHGNCAHRVGSQNQGNKRLAMQYRQYAPIDSLKHLVRYYWSLDSRQYSISQLSIHSFADRYPRLIFQDIDCFEPIINETGEEMPLCYLKGMRTRPTEAFMHGAFSHFGVS